MGPIHYLPLGQGIYGIQKIPKGCKRVAINYWERGCEILMYVWGKNLPPPFDPFKNLIIYLKSQKKVLKWFYVNPKELPNHLVPFVVYKRFPIHSDMNFPTHPLTINDLAPYHALNNHIYYFECLPSLRAILFMLGRSD